MRKEIETTETAYFCDICGNEITDAHWAYGGYASAAEETERCFLCKRDTCPNCREHITTLKEDLSFFPESKVICKDCSTLNDDIIKQIKVIKEKYKQEVSNLKDKYKQIEEKLGDFQIFKEQTK